MKPSGAVLLSQCQPLYGPGVSCPHLVPSPDSAYFSVVSYAATSSLCAPVGAGLGAGGGGSWDSEQASLSCTPGVPQPYPIYFLVDWAVLRAGACGIP